MNIVNVGHDSTNYYVLGQGNTRLLIDVGWPGTLPKLLAHLKRKDIPLQDIRYLLITHYHPDHAGLAQELKNKGARLIVLESQVDAIPVLKKYMKPSSPYVDILLHDNLDLRIAESRKFLPSIGLEGEIVSTPGHSDDSITLALDAGAAFTGDLPSPAHVDENAYETTRQSWQKLQAMNVAMIYPGHGPVRFMQQIIDQTE